ncbi:AraC family transcriptional regulator [Ferrovibrio sp.]|uniref:AraC family transcriptional regulator n=1 Tax=Ferrovibrio sp. TaxID=1917215 RepID=UPI0026326656|nr:AraC family transcriptional regulator [Ferrovibrio sp.]
MTGVHPKDWLSFARDPQSGTEAVRACFHNHAYDPHFHDQVLVGVTEQGLQQFRCRRQLHRSTPGRVILMEPGETHDGEAGASTGFTYAMLYFDPAWLRDAVALYAGRGDGRAVLGFPAILADDPRLAQAIGAAWRQVARPDSRMAREAALDAVAALLWRRRNPAGATAIRAPRMAAQARAIIDDCFDADLGLQDLALELDTDRFRLTRAFKAAYGLAPHAYLVQRRLSRARQMLVRGEMPAAAAAATGFADQSHFGRWFRRAYGMTPAAYRRACTNLPDSLPA